MKWYEKTAMVLSALGAISLGLIVLNVDVVGIIPNDIAMNVVYVIVGLSGIWALVKAFK